MWPKLRSNFLKISLWLFLIALPLGTRHLLYRFAPAIGDYGSVFVYLSDLALALLLTVFFVDLRGIFWEKPKSLAAFLFFAGFSVLFAASRGLAIYGFVDLAFLALGALVFAKILRTGRVGEKDIFGGIVAAAVLESLLAFWQFIKQGSVGLALLGEPVIGSEISGVAKVVMGGSKLVRAYGTFPHPNVLAAFLLLGLCALYYFWLRRPSEWKIFSSFKNLFSDLVIGVGIFVVLLGLLTTFSRTAWAIGAVLTGLTIGGALFRKTAFRQGIRLFILTAAVAFIFYQNFGVYLTARAQVSAGEPAVTLRTAYLRLGWDLLKSHPLGVGGGNQVYYSVLSGIYKKFGLTQTWQWQPVHNLYLLAADEIGALGALAFLIFLIKTIIHNPLLTIPKAMLLALLLFGLADHFLWTSQPGRLMLWLVIGIVIGVSSETAETRP